LLASPASNHLFLFGRSKPVKEKLISAIYAIVVSTALILANLAIGVW
jgi:hypothetical protein